MTTTSRARFAPRTLASLAAAAALVAGLAGCSSDDASSGGVGEQASGAINAATCAVLNPILSGVTDQVDAAVREIESDPAAARASLEEISTRLTTAAAAGGDRVGEYLSLVTSALDSLIGLAEKAEAGTTVSENDRTGAAESVDAALSSLITRCD